MEKIAYKLLKELYKKEKMDRDSVNKLTRYKKNDNYNPYISYLMEEKLVVLFSRVNKFGERLAGTALLPVFWFKLGFA